jgi:hypothetical protein
VRDAKRRGDGALVAMTDDKGFSVREAVGWWRSGVILREATRLRRLADRPSGGRTVNARRGSGARLAAPQGPI